MREVVPDQEKPDLSELAKHKQKALAKEKLKERTVKQSANRTAERLKKANLNRSSFANQPSYPWDEDNSKRQPKNPFIIDEK
ncbi:hypothetical protein [Lactococcus lactis]|nr:hypothetical protein [Lactococcus lactis]